MPGVAQQRDNTLAGNPVQERAIGLWREDRSVLDHEDVGCSRFGDIAEHVAD